MTSPDFAALRDTFPVTSRGVYLNTGWAGPSSVPVIEAMKARAEREAFEGPQSIDVRNEKARLVQAARGAVARLIGADEDEVPLMYTTTEGVNTVLRGLGLGAGDEIITCNLEHNSVMVPAYMSRLRDGASVQVVRFPSSDETAQSVVETFARAMTPATRLFVLSHVSWNRGTRLPMREICEMAHARGALVCVDAAQSAGHIEFDVHEMGCDFLALPVQKWLLAPAGAAFLFVRRELIERLQPLAVVHGANRNYDYHGNFDYANDTIHKFELTTHSGPVLAAVVRSLEMFEGLTMPAVERRCVELAGRFLEGLPRIDGVRITTPLDPSVRSGIVTWQIGELNPHECTAALWEADRIAVRVCNESRLRACFHVFNDESDVDRTVTAVARLAREGVPAGTPSEAEWKSRLLEAED